MKKNKFLYVLISLLGVGVLASCGRAPAGSSQTPTSEAPTSVVTSEDPTSEDPTSVDPTSEDPTSEETTSEDPTSEEVTSEDPTSEEETSEDPTSEETSTEPSSEEEVDPVPGEGTNLYAIINNGAPILLESRYDPMDADIFQYYIEGIDLTTDDVLAVGFENGYPLYPELGQGMDRYIYFSGDGASMTMNGNFSFYFNVEVNEETGEVSVVLWVAKTPVPVNLTLAAPEDLTGKALFVHLWDDNGANTTIYEYQVDANNVSLSLPDNYTGFLIGYLSEGTELLDDWSNVAKQSDNLNYSSTSFAWKGDTPVAQDAKMIVAPQGVWDSAVEHKLTPKQDDANEYVIEGVNLVEGDLIYFNLGNDVYKHYSDLKEGGASAKFGNDGDNLSVLFDGEYDFYVKVIPDDNGSIWTVFKGEEPIDPPVSETIYYLAGNFNSWAAKDATYTLVVDAEDANHYSFANLKLGKGQELKVNDSKGVWHDENGGSDGANTVASEAGTYTVHFYAKVTGSDKAIVLQKTGDYEEPETTYYLVGTIGGENCWSTEKGIALIAGENAGEYVLAQAVALKANDELKVLGSNGNWYPGGSGNNYVIRAAGNYQVTFNPDGHEGWYCNYFNVTLAGDTPEQPTKTFTATLNGEAYTLEDVKPETSTNIAEFKVTLKVGDKLVVKYGDAVLGFYHWDEEKQQSVKDADLLEALVAGEYVLYVNDKEEIYISAPTGDTPEQPEVTYYLVGTIGGEDCWSAEKGIALVAGENEGEYVLAQAVALKANDALKVLGSNGTWYPDGMNNDYVITAAGNYNVTFNPDGHEGWYHNFFSVVLASEEPGDDPVVIAAGYYLVGNDAFLNDASKEAWTVGDGYKMNTEEIAETNNAELLNLVVAQYSEFKVVNYVDAENVTWINVLGDTYDFCAISEAENNDNLVFSKAGIYNFYFSKDGKLYITEHEHAYGEIEVVKAPTRTDKGVGKKTCACGHSIEEEMDIVATNVLIIGTANANNYNMDVHLDGLAQEAGYKAVTSTYVTVGSNYTFKNMLDTTDENSFGSRINALLAENEYDVIIVSIPRMVTKGSDDVIAAETRYLRQFKDVLLAETDEVYLMSFNIDWGTTPKLYSVDESGNYVEAGSSTYTHQETSKYFDTIGEQWAEMTGFELIKYATCIVEYRTANSGFSANTAAYMQGTILYYSLFNKEVANNTQYHREIKSSFSDKSATTIRTYTITYSTYEEAEA